MNPPDPYNLAASPGPDGAIPFDIEPVTPLPHRPHVVPHLSHTSCEFSLIPMRVRQLILQEFYLLRLAELRGYLRIVTTGQPSAVPNLVPFYGYFGRDITRDVFLVFSSVATTSAGYSSGLVIRITDFWSHDENDATPSAELAIRRRKLSCTCWARLPMKLRYLVCEEGSVSVTVDMLNRLERIRGMTGVKIVGSWQDWKDEILSNLTLFGFVNDIWSHEALIHLSGKCPRLRTLRIMFWTVEEDVRRGSNPSEEEEIALHAEWYPCEFLNLRSFTVICTNVYEFYSLPENLNMALSMPRLKRLDCRHIALRDEQIQYLIEMGTLRDISLDECELGDQAPRLFECENLRRLSFSFSELNPIRFLDVQISPECRLEDVRLCQIRDIPIGLFEKLMRVETICYLNLTLCELGEEFVELLLTFEDCWSDVVVEMAGCEGISKKQGRAIRQRKPHIRLSL